MREPENLPGPWVDYQPHRSREKEFYDVMLLDGAIVECCYPNGVHFTSMINGHRVGDEEVARIRLCKHPFDDDRVASTDDGDKKIMLVGPSEDDQRVSAAVARALDRHQRLRERRAMGEMLACVSLVSALGGFGISMRARLRLERPVEPMDPAIDQKIAEAAQVDAQNRIARSEAKRARQAARRQAQLP